MLISVGRIRCSVLQRPSYGYNVKLIKYNISDRATVRTFSAWQTAHQRNQRYTQPKNSGAISSRKQNVKKRSAADKHSTIEGYSDALSKTAGSWIKSFFDTYMDHDVESNPIISRPHLNPNTFHKNLPYKLALKVQASSDVHKRFEELLSYEDLLKIHPKVVIGFYNDKLDNLLTAGYKRILAPKLLAKCINYLLVHKEFEFAARLLLDNIIAVSAKPSVSPFDSSSGALELPILLKSKQPGLNRPARHGSISFMDLDHYITSFYQRYRAWYRSNSTISENVNLNYLIFLQRIFSMILERVSDHNTELALKQLIQSFLSSIRYQYPDMHELFMFMTVPSKLSYPSPPNEIFDDILYSFKIHKQLSMAFDQLADECPNDYTHAFMHYSAFIKSLLSSLKSGNLDQNQRGEAGTDKQSRNETMQVFSMLNMMTIMKHYALLQQHHAIILMLGQIVKKLDDLQIAHKHISQFNKPRGNKSPAHTALFGEGGLIQYLLQADTSTSTNNEPSTSFRHLLDIFRKFKSLEIKCISTIHKMSDEKLLNELYIFGNLVKHSQSDYNFMIKHVHSIDDLNMFIQYLLKTKVMQVSSIEGLKSSTKSIANSSTSRKLSLEGYSYIFGKFSKLLSTEVGSKLNIKAQKNHDRFLNYFKITLINFYHDFYFYFVSENQPPQELFSSYRKIAHTLHTCLTEHKALFTLFLVEAPQLAKFNSKILNFLLREVLKKNPSDKLYLFFDLLNNKNFPVSRTITTFNPHFLRIISSSIYSLEPTAEKVETYKLENILKMNRWAFKSVNDKKGLLSFLRAVLKVSSEKRANSDKEQTWKVNLISQVYDLLFVKDNQNADLDLKMLLRLVKLLSSVDLNVELLLSHLQNKPHYAKFKKQLLIQNLRFGKLLPKQVDSLLSLQKYTQSSRPSTAEHTSNTIKGDVLDTVRLASRYIEYLASQNLNQSAAFYKYYIQQIDTHFPDLKRQALYLLRSQIVLGAVKDPNNLSNRRIRVANKLIMSILKSSDKYVHIKPSILETFLTSYIAYVEHRQVGSIKFASWLFSLYLRTSKTIVNSDKAEHFIAQFHRHLLSMKVSKKGFWSLQNSKKSKALLQKFYDA